LGRIVGDWAKNVGGGFSGDDRDLDMVSNVLHRGWLFDNTNWGSGLKNLDWRASFKDFSWRYLFNNLLGRNLFKNFLGRLRN